MPREILLTVLLLAVPLAGCVSSPEARYPRPSEVDHVVVYTTGREPARDGTNGTDRWARSTPLEPSNRTHQRIVEHALPLLEDVDEGSLQHARIGSASQTPGADRDHVDLRFARDTPAGWPDETPLPSTYLRTLRIVLDPAVGSEGIIALETAHGWYWWRTAADLTAIEEASAPVRAQAALEARESASVVVKRPGEGPECDAKGFAADGIGLARIEFAKGANATLVLGNASRVREAGSFRLDEVNRTLAVDEMPAGPVHLAVLLEEQGEEASRLVLGACRFLQLGWAARNGTELYQFAFPDRLRFEHLEAGCPKNVTIPARNESYERDLFTSSIEPGHLAHVRYLAGEESSCPQARFSYRYAVGWTLAER